MLRDLQLVENICSGDMNTWGSYFYKDINGTKRYLTAKILLNIKPHIS